MNLTNDDKWPKCSLLRKTSQIIIFLLFYFYWHPRWQDHVFHRYGPLDRYYLKLRSWTCEPLSPLSVALIYGDLQVTETILFWNQIHARDVYPSREMKSRLISHCGQSGNECSWIAQNFFNLPKSLWTICFVQNLNSNRREIIRASGGLPPGIARKYLFGDTL